MSAPAPAAAPFRGSAPFLQKAPPLSLPLRHFAAAALAFALFGAAFLYGADRFLGFDHQARWVLGLVHTLTLGWVAMTVLGALVQMAPVLWEVNLQWQKAVTIAWWLFTASVAAFVGMLWSGADGYWIPAVGLLLSVALYLAPLWRTMREARRLDWTGTHLLIGSLYLAALAILGVMLAWDRQRGILFPDAEGALIAHIHLALVGWVSMTIFGVSYRLVSMFALAHVEDRTLGRVALALANIGLIGLSLDSLWLGRRWLPLWSLVLAAAYLAYAGQMRRIFSARNRRIDPALAFTVLAMAGGLAWATLGVLLGTGVLESSTERRAAYLFAALVGWATPYILGQAHKIVPFLVWLHVYSPRNWKPPVKVPTIADLTSDRLAWAELAALSAAVPLGLAGFLAESQGLLRLSGVALASCAGLYLANVGATLTHIVRRDPRWTAPS